jgi:hypothetical protein
MLHILNWIALIVGWLVLISGACVLLAVLGSYTLDTLRRRRQSRLDDNVSEMRSQGANGHRPR